MKGVSSNQKRIEHHPEAPNIRCLSRVGPSSVEDLGTHIGWAAMFVRQRIIFTLDYVCVFQAFQSKLGSVGEKLSDYFQTSCYGKARPSQ